MIEDIVQRLRRAARGDSIPGLYEDAAAEIERLRKTSHWFRAKEPLGIPVQNDRKALSPNKSGRKKDMTLAERLQARTETDENGCWIWQGVTYAGYGRVRMPPAGRPGFCHRLMYEEVNGLLPKKMCVMHLCDNRRCINPDHLRAGTHTENMIDRSRKGRSTAMLTADQVLEIRQKNKDGVGQTKLADMYGVSTGTISAICTRKTWKWLEDTDACRST